MIRTEIIVRKKINKTSKEALPLLLRKCTTKYIYRIYRIDKKIIEIRHKTGNSINNISILSPYAPHIGYDKEINEYWAKIQNYIKPMPSNLIKMRRTDNNGQIASNKTCNLIGKWTIAKTNEEGNGENITKR